MTPGLLVLAVAALVGALHYVDLPWLDRAPFAASLVTGCNVMIGFMLMSYFWHAKPSWLKKDSDRTWELASFGTFAVLMILSYASGLRASAPGAFWVLYGTVALTTFGLLGQAYETREAYYTGWLGGWIDDPFTNRDDLDRAHLSLGIVAAFPTFIISCYAEIVTAVIRPLRDDEIDAAADVLIAAAANDPESARSAVDRLGPRSATHIAQALSKLEMIKPGAGMKLTKDGLAFVR
jgi:hypothetical protein